MIQPATAKLIDQSFAADLEREKRRRMETGQLDLELAGAPEDPAVGDQAFQVELETFCGALHQAGISYSQRAIAFDAINALGYPLGEFAILVLGPSAVHVLSSAINAWLRGKAQRKVRMKFGDVDVQASTPEEVEKLLESAAKFQSTRSKSLKNK